MCAEATAVGATADPVFYTQSSEFRARNPKLGARRKAPLGGADDLFQPEQERYKKYFDDKQSIKPWLHSQLVSKGINIVIERSDDTKIVFKCKNSHSFAPSAHCAKMTKLSKSLTKDAGKRQKGNCPFRIRANYSLRAKKWSIVVVNDQHNHALYPSGSRQAESDSRSGAGSSVQKPALTAPLISKRPTFGPTNTLLMAAQTANTQLQPMPKFQLPLPLNFGHVQHTPMQAGSESLSTSKSSSSSSSPKLSFAESASLAVKDAKAGQSTPQQQQRLSVLHIEINNLLLHLNTSSGLSDANKEETYFKIISTLKDTLKQQNPHAYSPTSGTNSPSHTLSHNTLFNYTTNNAPGSSSEKIMLPSISNTLHGSLQSIRTANGAGAVGVNAGGSYSQYYL
ncbi:hypothetical protein KL921_005070 [Ogataea angusta]|uniref:Uncharacterized protein n=1 Tax=Pichia angusta TaxID=870730 RepID=A0AAN6I8X2_PICAN|nr:uncharacterized protein KL928_000153 [Ogataea angusta]KAG7806342.1 hypothetical protein KL921_005070 [Ogataea angusta]KAG7821678.1 hypothetical protein KL928_000153 [Ogataea angusta]KAG7836968.1 hypothetical protein KL943_001007 [Ogataea angusta]KAG7853101.1 hypothetical protein KL941_000151 [Ogataea angusta]